MPIVDDEMVCPGCGAAIEKEQKVCEYCGRKLTVTALTFKSMRKATLRESERFLKTYQGALKDSPDNPQVLASLGLVLMGRGQYQEAAAKLERAMSNGSDNPDVVFHAALARYKCKKPFQIKLAEGKSIISTIDSAITMNPDPQYFYAKAVIIREVFEKRYLNYRERSNDVLAQAGSLTEDDRAEMDAILAD